MIALGASFMLPALAGVTVLGGCGSSDAVSASAGPDQAVLINAVVTLDGNGSTGVSSVKWTFTSKPTGSSASITNDTSLSPTFTPDLVGDYVARLSVNNNAAVDTVTISASAAAVSIIVPTTSTIATRTRLGVVENVVDMGATGATLSAAGSTVAGLKLKNDAIVYHWEQIQGPEATIDESTRASEVLSFTAPTIDKIQHRSDSMKWEILPISKEDTRMTFRLRINGTDSSTFDVYIQDDGKEIHPSTGLPNVGVGSKVYLNGAGCKTTDHGNCTLGYTAWSWSLSKPSGSNASFDDSGTSTSTTQFPTFTPDVPGLYSVTYCNPTTACPTAQLIRTATAYVGKVGTAATLANNTNAPIVITPGTIQINAGTYVGVGTIGETTPGREQCASCHDGTDRSGRDYGDLVTEWETTKHSHVFSDNMDANTYQSLAPEPYLWQLHTTGFNKDASNDGFDDLLNTYNFTLISSSLSYADFVTNNPDVARLANVQCESCHGPGSQHIGDPVGTAFSKSEGGVCGQCHTEETLWKVSKHNSISTSSYGTWLYNDACTKCHTTEGFVAYMDAGGVDNHDAAVTAVVPLATATISTNRAFSSTVAADPVRYPKAFGAVTCLACHDPHNKANDYQLRIAGEVSLMKPADTDLATTYSSVTLNKVNAGHGAICYECHFGNRELNENNCVADTTGVIGSKCDTWQKTVTNYPGNAFHDVTQAGILEGVMAFNDLDGDSTTTADSFSVTNVNSFHSGSDFVLSTVTGDTSLSSQNNKCVTCHMAPGPAKTEEGYGLLGGHAFHMTPTTSTDEDETDNVDITEVQNVTNACQPCHGDKMTDYNREARADYDGDGTVEGIQDEVKGLLVALSTLIKANTAANQSGVSSVKTDYDDTWSLAWCTSDAQCATGSVDGAAGSCTAKACTTAADCGSASGETCDAGACSTTKSCKHFAVKNGSFVLAATGAVNPVSLSYVGTSANMPLASSAALTAGDAGDGTNGNCTYIAGLGAGHYATWFDNTSKKKQGYLTCNFLATDDIMKRAIWNHNAIVIDDSFGIHNAGYTIRVLQGTYQGLIRGLSAKGFTVKNKAGTTVSASNAANFTYQSDYPAATLR